MILKNVTQLIHTGRLIRAPLLRPGYPNTKGNNYKLRSNIETCNILCIMQLYFMHINSLINVSLISISIILCHMANGALYSHPRDTKVPTTLLPIRTMLNVRNCYPRSRTPHPRSKEQEMNPRCPRPIYEDLATLPLLDLTSQTQLATGFGT